MATELCSIEELFEKDSAWLETHVLKLVSDMKTGEKFRYVQVRRNVVQTFFSEKHVLQITDISQKVLYETAMGERRLLQLINATVSHEMRNPINSIHM